MATRMLIDARHPEETRVAVLKGNRIDEFDFESADRKQIKGNIYLAKVTRVEPSLQAAFVDFGGNRHGFLAFSEIHPDYYQIPKEDREALLAEEAAHAEEEAALRAADDESDFGQDDEDGGFTEVDTSEKDDVSTIEAGHVEDGDEDGDDGEDDSEHSGASGSDEEDSRPQRRGRRRQGRGKSKDADEVRSKRMALRRRYKIQDVIQRRQVLLVQVVKEERGNKGAALTSYLSLAGRYCVLMPNSNHGGGISRKINSAADRKRLKTIVNELNLPNTMGCIVRTAGLSRTKTEIKRDFDYLARLWDELRETTLKSSAPTLIHSDSDLIKRAIRDIYNRDIEEVIVEGEEGYKAAKSFMKLLMPSHARRVKPYSDPVPLFQRYGAEDQLSAMYEPEVQLKSGGYIVINPTEALVSIDINSGRSTKEHGIEATAVSTNLEAAHEIARQLRLRDMAGLVVIDFIDMEYGSNIRKVEKAMKEALKTDRARIQVGRISSFGLMEMSRQRLRTGVLEATTRGCPHCDGTGLVRTASSAGLSALRLIEDEAAKGKGSTVTLYASTEAAVYLLNAKRSDLAEIEVRYGVTVEVIPDGENEGAKMRVTSSGTRTEAVPVFEPIVDDEPDEDEVELEVEDDIEEESSRRGRRKRGRGRGRDRQDDQQTDDESAEDRETADVASQDEDDGEAPKKRRRRGGRRRRGRGRGGENGEVQMSPDSASEGREEASPTEQESESTAPAEQGETMPQDQPSAPTEADAQAGAQADLEQAADAPTEPEPEPEPKPKPKRTRRKKVPVQTETEMPATSEESAVEAELPAPEPEPKPKPKRTRRKKVEAESTASEAGTATDNAPDQVAAETVAASEEQPAPSSAPEAQVAPELASSDEAAATRDDDSHGSAANDLSDETPRRGWWQRTFGN